jgi:predicted nucleic acid-binding protein
MQHKRLTAVALAVTVGGVGVATAIATPGTGISAYDAAYAALAEVITDGGAPLLTADARLARAAGEHTELRVLLAE